MLDTLVITAAIAQTPVLWVHSPAMFAFASHLAVAATVHDCMDELSAFRFADPELGMREAALMRRADVVFTGGHSLFEAKRALQDNIHPFSSAVDADHFAAARTPLTPPADQAPSLGPASAITASSTNASTLSFWTPSPENGRTCRS